jgi:hypothetical protein
MELSVPPHCTTANPILHIAYLNQCHPESTQPPLATLMPPSSLPMHLLSWASKYLDLLLLFSFLALTQT